MILNDIVWLIKSLGAHSSLLSHAPKKENEIFRDEQLRNCWLFKNYERNPY